MAFSEGVDELTTALPNIKEQTQLVLGSAGASEAKNLAVCEIIRAVPSYASACVIL